MAKKIREVLGMAHLSSTARLTYAWIFWTARGGYSDATSADLSERIGVGDDAISSAARELEAANLVRRERAGAKGKGNKRWVLIGALSLAVVGGTATQSDAAPYLKPQPTECFLISTQKKRQAGFSGPNWRLLLFIPRSRLPQ